MAFSDAVKEAFSGCLENFGLPGVGWYVQRGDEIVEGVSGSCRAVEDSPPLTTHQQWHWGSCAKALTATVVAALVEEGQFKSGWDTPLSAILDASVLPGESELAAVTLRQLATHRSGVRLDLETEEEEKLKQDTSGLSLVEQRKAFVSKLAEKSLEHPPGHGFGYSNAGFVVLSAAAETAAKRPWEELVTSRVSEPLGMDSFGFGCPPASASTASGHNELCEVDDTQDAPWHHASFSVHSTLADWAKFAQLHLRVLRGDNAALAPLGVGPEGAQLLQTPVSPAKVDEAFHGPEKPLSMAMGWQCLWDEPPDGQSDLAAPTGVLWHWGTNFGFNSGIFLRAEPQLLILIGLNSGSSLARLASRMAFEATIAAAEN